jgi:hypothetical protein
MKVLLNILSISFLVSCSTPAQRELHSRYAEINKAQSEGKISDKESIEMKNAAHKAYAIGGGD